MEPSSAPASPAQPEPATGDELVVVAEGGAAIPAEVRLGVMWGNEKAKPPIVVSPLSTTAGPAGALRLAALPAPPEAMLLREGEVGLAIGYLVAFQDGDGDGTLTPAAGKPWRWPEFRGGVNRYVVVYATAPVREGTRLHRFVGAHPGGLELMHVELTATCEGDGCVGHDEMSLGPRPQRLTLVLPADPASYRFPNVD